MKIYITLILIFCSMFSNAQTIIIGGQQTNRKLTWADFNGRIDKSNPHFAYTTYKINYKVDDISVLGDSIRIGKFEVILELDPDKTWARKDKVTDELLVHEQGHFNIGILHLNEILSEYHKANFTKTNFNFLMQKIINDASRKYNQMSLKYDEETKHFMDKEQQKKWDAFFADNLGKKTD